jgi:hypothetical protein
MQKSDPRKQATLGRPSNPEECREVSVPVRQGSVDAEIQTLRNANGELDCLIDSLASRIIDILGDNAGEETCPTNSPMPNSNLASAIREESNHLSNSCRKIAEILQRVEL